MAKDNFILHNASGKVGNLVTYKREGKQVTREWVAEVKNPKTYLQSQQRNFLAPVSKFFAPLAVALETSFEGLSKAKSHSKFQKENINLARREGFYMPKGLNFFPAPYKLSQGTLTPIRCTQTNESDDDIAIGGSYAFGDFNLGSFSKMMIEQYGAKDGDQVTIIMVVDLKEDINQITLEDDFLPTYRRFYLDSTSTEEIGSDQGINITYQGVSGSIDEAAINNNIAGSTMVAAAIILSRWENGKWRRSTQYLYCKPQLLGLIKGTNAKENAIQSYMEQNYAKQSDIYLNGSTGTSEEEIPTSITFPYTTLSIGGVELTIASRVIGNVTIGGENRSVYLGEVTPESPDPAKFLVTKKSTGVRYAISPSGGGWAAIEVASPGQLDLLATSDLPESESDAMTIAAYKNFLALVGKSNSLKTYVVGLENS